MSIKGLKGGTRLRELHGQNLLELQDMLEELPYKVDIVGINKVGAEWYIHFIIPNLVAAEIPINVEIAKPTQTKRIKK